MLTILVCVTEMSTVEPSYRAMLVFGEENSIYPMAESVVAIAESGNRDFAASPAALVSFGVASSRGEKIPMAEAFTLNPRESGVNRPMQ